MYNGSIPVGGVAAGGGFGALTAAGSPIELALAVTTLIVAVTALATLIPRLYLKRKG
jgi:hypothetical protein